MALYLKDPAQARRMRERLKDAPGMEEFFRELHALGLVDGWRCLLAVNEPLDLRGCIEVCGPHHTGYEFCKK